MGPGLVSLSKMSGAERKAEAKTMQGTSGLRVVLFQLPKFSLVSALKYMILLLRWLFQEKK